MGFKLFLGRNGIRELRGSKNLGDGDIGSLSMY